ncbi:lycopene beta-cyclase CrtY [Novosphingobium sp. FKTRR1]|uniref:lycopene beta-cyclase CrtY n=1 Tax=Novosphingobium sp. FKTRR1 TaxID=2879118 RepID=UPI001CF001B5|nr:lycopene beta-cyclase CrtY [Novosphingobium sp. FKTRR1]
MTEQHCDIAILGGGLSGGLIALALAARRPDLKVSILEAAPALGGNHVWSVFDTDLQPGAEALLAPLVTARWEGYDVRFPAHSRQLDTPYATMTSARLDATLRATLPADAIHCNATVVSATPREVRLADGSRFAADAVIDTRGLKDFSAFKGGWQKFVGLHLKLYRPHLLTRPIVMDATVDQHDGYRFVYSLPFNATEVFVEDTYYADGPALDVTSLRQRVLAYAESQGWAVAQVVAEEQGVLPVVAGGDFDTLWPQSGRDMPRAGTRAGLFHPLTSYSVPDAVRFALALADRIDLTSNGLADFSQRWSSKHWKEGSFFRMLTAMLFAAADPDKRYRVLERFYRLDSRLIERFYAGQPTLLDKVRVLAGKPPVPLGRAIGVISGLGNRPAPLQHPRRQEH